MQHGKAIDLIIRGNHFSIDEISKKLKITGQSIYTWFHKESIVKGSVFKTEKTINLDFSSNFSEFSDAQELLNNQLIQNQNIKTVRLESVIYWRNKYLMFVEKQEEVLKNSPMGPTSHQNN